MTTKKHITTGQEALRKRLIAKLHVLKGKSGMTTSEYQGILGSFGASSSGELNIDQLKEAVSLLEKRATATPSAQPVEDLWRKRVIAAIHEYFRLTNRAVTMDMVKAVACRAAGNHDKFNSIPIDRLRAVYNSFTNQCKVFRRTGEMLNEDLLVLQFRN